MAKRNLAERDVTKMKQDRIFKKERIDSSKYYKAIIGVIIISW